MMAAADVAIAERTPEAVLEFWLGRLRTASDASRRNWQQGMLRWRIGPFARGTEDPNILRVQREWCDQMHREGPDDFFRDPVWDTPKGLLARLIVLDQFPRGVYRGTALAYANDPITASLSWQACEADREFAHYNGIERFWIYLPLSHAEDLTFQELSIEKFARWSVDLIAEAPPDRRRINQFVSWSMVRAALEHSEALLLFDRFPHRNAVMQRPHRGGEVRYLTDPMRPLWSFTQPPDPGYFALLGALCRMGNGVDESRITREALAGLVRASSGPLPEDAASPMDVFGLAGGDVLPFPVLYRHLRLPEHAQTFERLQRMPLVLDLMNAVKRLILRDEDLSWPPRSAKDSIHPAIDVAALNALVRGEGPSGAAAGKDPVESSTRGDGNARTAPSDPEPAPPRVLRLAVRNVSRELERVGEAVENFAERHGFPHEDRFQMQLCIEELLMYIAEHAFDDADTHRIEVVLEMSNETRSLAIRTVDDGREVEPGAFMFQPGPDTIGEETVMDSLGLHLVRTYTRRNALQARGWSKSSQLAQADRQLNAGVRTCSRATPAPLSHPGNGAIDRDRARCALWAIQIAHWRGNAKPCGDRKSSSSALAKRGFAPAISFRTRESTMSSWSGGFWRTVGGIADGTASPWSPRTGPSAFREPSIGGPTRMASCGATTLRRILRCGRSASEVLSGPE